MLTCVAYLCKLQANHTTFQGYGVLCEKGTADVCCLSVDTPGALRLSTFKEDVYSCERGTAGS